MAAGYLNRLRVWAGVLRMTDVVEAPAGAGAELLHFARLISHKIIWLVAARESRRAATLAQRPPPSGFSRHYRAIAGHDSASRWLGKAVGAVSASMVRILLLPIEPPANVMVSKTGCPQ